MAPLLISAFLYNFLTDACVTFVLETVVRHPSPAEAQMWLDWKGAHVCITLLLRYRCGPYPLFRRNPVKRASRQGSFVKSRWQTSHVSRTLAKFLRMYVQGSKMNVSSASQERCPLTAVWYPTWLRHAGLWVMAKVSSM